MREDNTIKSLPEIRGVDSSQRTFEFISFLGERFVATIHDMHRMIRLDYPGGGSKDATIVDIINGTAKFDKHKGYDEDVQDWLKCVIKISEEQQKVIVYQKGANKMWLHEGLKGQYVVRYLQGDEQQRISLTIPKLTITGTYSELKRLDVLFGMMEGGQLSRLLSLVRERQIKGLNGE